MEPCDSWIAKSPGRDRVSTRRRIPSERGVRIAQIASLSVRYGNAAAAARPRRSGSRSSLFGRPRRRRHDNVAAMSFRITSGAPSQELVESAETATGALDRIHELAKSGAPNVRVVRENGVACSLSELEGLAEFENESDDA